MFKLAALLFAVPLTTGLTSVEAQEMPGRADSLNSAILKEKRMIQVVLPRDYTPGTAKRYDVLYVTDGETNTKLATDIQHFIQDEGYMPPIIIVGILNTDRTRDLTPTHDPGTGNSGGATAFLSFLKNELIPYVDKNYPTDGDNMLWGHSFGGLFAAYALLTDPQVFHCYIAADPSFWWDKHYMNHVFTERLPGLAGLNRVFYFSGREGGGLEGMGIPPVDSILKKSAPTDLTWKLSPYPGETHGSVRLKSMYDGLKFTYAGYTARPPEFHPMNGALLKDKPIQLFYMGNSSTVHYTTDGTAPALSSPKMQQMNTINGPATVVAVGFSNHHAQDHADTGLFTLSDYWKSGKMPAKAKPGGLHYAYYEGSWDKLPDFSQLTPIKTGVADSAFSLARLPRRTGFGLVLEGELEIKEDGYYLFGLQSDDGSKMYLDHQLILDDDGLHDDQDSKSYIVPLQKGFYPIRIDYFQKDGGAGLRLIYLTPSTMTGKNPAPIPLNLQYSAVK